MTQDVTFTDLRGNKFLDTFVHYVHNVKPKEFYQIREYYRQNQKKIHSVKVKKSILSNMSMSNSNDERHAVSSFRAHCRPLIVAVENIESGKSTFLYYCKAIENIKVISEPINECTDVGDINLLVDV